MEEATRKALAQLNAGLDKVEITVLNEGRNGILGLGGEDARIRVRLRAPENDESDRLIETAGEILSNILSKMGIQATIEVKEHLAILDDEGIGSPVILNIIGDDLGILIGRRGQVLDAIQYLVRLMLAKHGRSRFPITIDVEDYKLRRYQDLRTLALNVAEQVKTNSTSLKLEPMSAFERRIIHMTLANDPDVSTESTGEGEYRKVVIISKKLRGR